MGLLAVRPRPTSCIVWEDKPYFMEMERRPLELQEVFDAGIVECAHGHDIARAPGSYHITRMALDDLTDDELQAVIALVRNKVREHRFPHSDRIRTLRNALSKLDPASAPKPVEPRPALPSGTRPRKARR
jgi:hypothetical protein